MKIEEVVYAADEDAPKGWSVDMTMDEGAAAHLMKVLTDMYANPILAVIREYSTNAVDAHVDAGIGLYAGSKQRPVEVTLPTTDDPHFRVRDFGKGLTYNDIEVMYSRYGASTKRNTDTAVGMLGLGCKSALTYTDAFSLRGIVNQDGVHVESKVEVRRTNTGGTMTVLGEEFTDEETGVEIIIPVKPGDLHTFREEAKNFFRFWDDNTVLVDGKAPERIKGYELAPKMIISSEVDENTVVMGGVPYPMKDFHVSALAWNYHVVAWVNIGDVHFVPSREDLADTSKTQETVSQLKATANAELKPALDKVLDGASTYYEALKLSKTLERVGLKKPVYKGVEIPTAIHRDPVKITVTNPDGRDIIQDDPDFLPLVINALHYRGNRSHTANRVPLEDDNITIWVEGSEEKKALTPYKREKLALWKVNNNITASRIILVDKLTADERRWINPALIYNYADFKATKVVREKIERKDGRVSGSYPSHVKTKDDETPVYKYQLLAKDIDTSMPIFYVELNKSVRWSLLNMLHPKGYTVVSLGKNRIQKFTRDFPQAKQLKDYINEQAQKFVATLTEDDHYLIALSDSRDHNFLLRLDENRILDPALKQRVIDVKSIKGSKMLRKYDLFSGYIEVPEIELPDVTSSYPLALNTIYSHYKPDSEQMKHAYLYMNHIYSLSAQTEDHSADFFSRVGFVA